MNPKYEPLFTPFKIGEVEIPNRIVQCSMGGTTLFGWLEPSHFDLEGADFLLKRAKDGVGLVLPGMQVIRDTMGRKWLDSNRQMYRVLKPYMDEYHKTGGKLFIQLAGGFGRSMAVTPWMAALGRNDLLNKLASPIVDVQYACASASLICLIGIFIGISSSGHWQRFPSTSTAKRLRSTAEARITFFHASAIACASSCRSISACIGRLYCTLSGYFCQSKNTPN